MPPHTPGALIPGGDTRTKYLQPYRNDEKNRERIRQVKRIEREYERARIPVEGKFWEAKRRDSLGRAMTKLKKTSESAVMMVFLVR